MRKKTSVNYENEQILKFECPFVLTISLMGKRWKPAILWKISQGVNKFGKLKSAIPPITEKMLSQHLRELETDDLIFRLLSAEVPLKTEYCLTDKGISLLPILKQLKDWGDSNFNFYAIKADL